MKKISVVALFIGSVFAHNVFAENANYKDTSYAVGAYFASELKDMVDAQKGLVDYDRAKILAGVKDTLDGKVDLSDKQLGATLTELTAKLKADSQKKQAEQAQQAKADGEKFAAEFKKKDGVKETQSGLLYRIENAGNGETIKPTDLVKVHYTGKLPNGKVFDSSVQRGTPAEFKLNQVIPGWTEGLQLVKKGGKIELVIPAKLAYGESSTGPIPPNSTLYFEVEVLDVNPSK